MLANVHTADIGIVNRPANHSKRTVEARVAGSKETIMGRDGDEQAPQMVLGGVPFAQSPYIQGPIPQGQSGVIVYIGRSIDDYIVNGQDDSAPSDPRRHDPNDAIFLPATLRGAGEDTDVVVAFPPGSTGLARLRLEPSGAVDLGNGTENVAGLLYEALGALNTLATSLSTAPNIGAVNAAGSAAIITVAALQVRLATIKP